MDGYGSKGEGRVCGRSYILEGWELEHHLYEGSIGETSSRGFSGPGSRIAVRLLGAGKRSSPRA